MRSVKARWPAVLLVACLLGGCTGSPQGDSGLDARVARIVGATDGKLVTQILLSERPDETLVTVRLPGADRTFGMTGAVAGQDAPPAGARAVKYWDFAALNSQLEKAKAQCPTSPKVRARVTPAGVVVAESYCGTSPDVRVSEISYDAKPLATALDLGDPDGLTQLFAEFEASLPRRIAWQITIPGAAGQQRHATAAGYDWAMADGQLCQLAVLRRPVVTPGESLLTVGCDPQRPRFDGSSEQQEFLPSEVPAPALLAAVAEILTRNGIDAAKVRHYIVAKSLLEGFNVRVVTADGEFAAVI